MTQLRVSAAQYRQMVGADPAVPARPAKARHDHPGLPPERLFPPSGLVLGADPGGRFCGLVLVRDRELLAHRLVERTAGQGLAGWIGECYSAALLLVASHDALGNLRAERLTVAVEAVESPKSFIDGERRYRPKAEPLIATSAVMGALVMWAVAEGLPCLLVPPGGNGAGALVAYPEPLRPTRGRGKGTDKLVHCRSAWDVAQEARKMLAALAGTERLS